MTRERTSKATYEVIEKMAASAFKDFEINERHRHAYDDRFKHCGASRAIAGTWRVGRPGDSMHSFCVHVDLGVVTVYGDLGEFVIRCNDAYALRWLLFAGTSEDNGDGGSYCDYILGKVRASEEPRREFMIDDAREFLRTWEIEVKNELDEVDETTGMAIVDKRKQEQLDQIAMCRDVLDDHEYDAPSHQRYKWLEVMHEIGYDDPPLCEGWSPSMLWLWQAIKCFRRLFVAKFTTDINVESVAGHTQAAVVG